MSTNFIRGRPVSAPRLGAIGAGEGIRIAQQYSTDIEGDVSDEVGGAVHAGQIFSRNGQSAAVARGSGSRGWRRPV
jgi:hypothetical protein